MGELERGIFKIAGMGILAVVAYDALTHSDGVTGIVKAVLGSYNTTLRTIAGK